MTVYHPRKTHPFGCIRLIGGPGDPDPLDLNLPGVQSYMRIKYAEDPETYAEWRFKTQEALDIFNERYPE